VRRRLLPSLLVFIAIQLGCAAVASASVQFSSDSYQVSETSGQAIIEATRTGPPLLPTAVRYGTHRLDGVDGVDFDTVSGILNFAPGQTSATFSIPIIQHNFVGPPAQVAVFLYGSWPDDLGSPNNATLTILHDAPLEARDPANPLMLNPAPVNGNPLDGARFYVNRWGDPAGQAGALLQNTNPSWANALSVIARQPWTFRFGAWDGPDPSQHAFGLLEKYFLADPGAVPMLATYRIVHGQCARGGVADTPAEVAAYEKWIQGLAYGIGNFRAVLFLEMDSIITAPCLKPHALAVRLAELRYAITTLERDPHLVVYLDGGAADAAKWQNTARLLKGAGVQQAQGFFLNSTHFDWTTREIAFGQRIARALGGVHFVVNTGENGQGPLVPPDPGKNGAEVLCNPPGRGLGPLPTSNTGFQWVDAFAWTSNPGESGGRCNGAPATDYWPAYAVGLVEHASFTVNGPGERFLRRAQTVRRRAAR
jgi:endoglucanase